MRNTKIVATVGPATDAPGALDALLEAGVDVFRVNGSHGTPDEHKARVAAVREASVRKGDPVAVLLDLQGPKIRLGKFENGSVFLEKDREFTISTQECIGNVAKACTTYADFARDVKPGDPVLLNDGAVCLEVLDTDGIAARCRVMRAGEVGDRKGINLPGVQLSTPSLTKKDKADLVAGIDAGIDLIALSFVRKASDIQRMRLLLEEKEAAIPIVAKIEKPEALDNLDAILDESDGIMVARGDLGVELPVEQVPGIQKRLIESARQRGKFVITATQMLESMVSSASPTRAEVSDVANAIYDGSDAVMLSAETSKGKFPIEAVQMMARIAEYTEVEMHRKGYRVSSFGGPPGAKQSYADLIAELACRAAQTTGAAGIAVFTTSGASAKLVARFRPPVPIYAFTGSEQVALQLSVVYGIRPVVAPFVASTDQMLRQMDNILVSRRELKPRDGVVFVAGQPIGQKGTTNLLKLHRVGELG